MRIVWFLAAASVSMLTAAGMVLYMSHRRRRWAYGMWYEPEDGVQPSDVAPWERECE